jgi:hypothetical protein
LAKRVFLGQSATTPDKVKIKGEYDLVGEAYVDSIMHRESVEDRGNRVKYFT